MPAETEDTTAVATREIDPDYSDPAVRSAAVSALEGQVLLIQEAMQKTLQRGVHYGVIPGTQRPSLWQPGAEMLCQMFGFKTYMEQTAEYEDWQEGLFAYKYKCILTDRHGNHITERYATCSVRERQYKRQIAAGQDPAELIETLMLMAQKRAYVAAVRAAGACSAVFTQDDDIVPDQSSGQSRRQSAAGKSNINVPCQLGHDGQFWTSQKFAPAHAATPRWCSMAHWIKQLMTDLPEPEMKAMTKGLPGQYTKWTDEQFQKFWDNWTRREEEGVAELEDDAPVWEGELDENELNF